MADFRCCGKVPKVRGAALAGESPWKVSGAVRPVEVLGKVPKVQMRRKPKRLKVRCPVPQRLKVR